MDYSSKRAFNLLWGVNQGCGLLLARGLEKGQPVALVNTQRTLNALFQNSSPRPGEAVCPVDPDEELGALALGGHPHRQQQVPAGR